MPAPRSGSLVRSLVGVGTIFSIIGLVWETDGELKSHPVFAPHILPEGDVAGPEEDVESGPKDGGVVEYVAP